MDFLFTLFGKISSLGCLVSDWDSMLVLDLDWDLNWVSDLDLVLDWGSMSVLDLDLVLDLDSMSVLVLDCINFLASPPKVTVNLSLKGNLGISGSMSADKGTRYAESSFKCTGPDENPTNHEAD